MEYGSIERTIRVEASPEVVFEVVSSPEHVTQWWPDEADYEPIPGATGHISWRGRDTGDAMVEPITVVDADPPRRFSFRWVYREGQVAARDNSLLVTFELEPSGTGTLVHVTETGFRERGWEVAVLEEAYRDHGQGWDTFLPRLEAYVARLVAR